MEMPSKFGVPPPKEITIELKTVHCIFVGYELSIVPIVHLVLLTELFKVYQQTDNKQGLDARKLDRQDILTL